MGSGPVVPMVWEGLNAVKTGRVMLGATNPADSAPGTIRGDLCVQVGRNMCHGSDAVDSAAKGNIFNLLYILILLLRKFKSSCIYLWYQNSFLSEIALWFKEEDLVTWDPVAEKWVYED